MTLNSAGKLRNTLTEDSIGRLGAVGADGARGNSSVLTGHQFCGKSNYVTERQSFRGRLDIREHLSNTKSALRSVLQTHYLSNSGVVGFNGRDERSNIGGGQSDT